MNSQEPRSWLLSFLRLICPEHLYEEILGDLIQRYRRDLIAYGIRRAKIRMTVSVIGFCRPGIFMRNQFSFQRNQLSMFQNFFKISYRTLLRNKAFSIINISGLAIGMSAFFLIIHYVKFERSYEDFNKQANHVYRLTLEIYKGREYIMTDCGMYSPMGAILKSRLPEIQDVTRIWLHGSQEVKVDNKSFYEDKIYFAEPSIFKIFVFDMLAGDPASALSNPFQVVLSESMAKKYFGTTDVINKSIEIRKNTYKITGVTADSPLNTHLKVQFLLSHSTLSKRKDMDYKEDEFQGNSEFAYLLMHSDTDLAEFNNKLKTVSIEMKDDIGDDRMIAESMKDIHLYSNKAYEPEANGDSRSVYFLLIVAVFVIFIAWINYINLSTARAIDRAREVGIRKVLGSLKTQLIWQFLSESLLVTAMAAALSLAIVYIGLPAFSNLSGRELPSNIFGDRDFWYLFFGILISGAIASGLYPAFVLSSFNPVSVLKGKFRSSSHGQWLRKGLVVFQFTATGILIICVVTVYLQMNFLQHQELGMSLGKILALKAPTIDSDSIFMRRASALKQSLGLIPAITNVSQSGVLPGLSQGDFSTTGNVYRPGDEKLDRGTIYFINPFDENFISTYGMQLLSGRNFESDTPEDQIIINEKSMHTLGFKNADEAVGSKIFVYNTEVSIIGVLKNFHQRSPKEDHIPMIYWYGKHSDYFSLQVNTGDIQSTIATIKTFWAKIYPDSPFDYFFVDQTYNQQYKADQQFGKVIGVFSLLTILIAAMGLFGLSSFNVLQRTKEIGIRKVLGGSVMQIVKLLSQDYTKLVIGASILAIPFAHLAMQEWLSGFVARMPMKVWTFLLPLVIMILISIATISFQTIKAASANPGETLKYE
ncbi:MAG: ABC transporter permease [Chryseolinea sp.]